MPMRLVLSLCFALAAVMAVPPALRAAAAEAAPQAASDIRPQAAAGRDAPEKAAQEKAAPEKKDDEPRLGSDSGLPLPRFVSLAADKVNARTGPGARYPIAWQYQRRWLPVEVVAEYEYWRKIRDHDGTEAWVHKNLTSGKRYALVDGTVRALYGKPDANAEILLTAEPGVEARLRRCPNLAWCEVEIAGTRGWMPRGYLWGVYPNEIFD
ncbi:MAG TPA: SH3 domain-containing protein [Ferrovibrio sp.]|uniref:SH3 domain-containing protein n=1 Tax=Ferrovibrio sp. TaxID=1917215 RepID=UPI002ED65727